MDPAMESLLSFLFQRADATQTFWNFYAGAFTAMLGVVTAGKAAWLNRWVRAGLTAGFLIFAVANFSSLNALRKQRQELIYVAASLDGYEVYRQVIWAARPPTRAQLNLFHGALDIVALAAIWGIPYARNKWQETDRSG